MDERMDAPNGKRIVELLRKAAMGIYEGAKGKVMDNIAQLIGCYGAMDYRTIDKLADMVEEAIQHEHESAYDAGYDEGFASADDWCAQHEDAMAEHGWYRALDADKKPVCIGAAMDSDHYEDGTVVGLQFFNTANKNLRVLIAIRPHGWDTPTWRDLRAGRGGRGGQRREGAKVSATDESLPNDTKELDTLLNEHGQEHRVWPSGIVVWHDERTVYEYEPAKNHHDEYWGGILRMTMRHLTPAQAIAATLGSEDTYTREDVEGAFVSGYSLGLDMFDSSKPDNEKGWNQNERNLDEEMEDLGWVRKDAATLGAGTCHEVEDEDTGFIVCSECGAVHDEDYTNYYCWCCGRKVVGE